MSDAAIVNARVIIPFVQENGLSRDVEILPFTDRKIVEIDEWCKSQIIRVAAKAADGLPTEIQDRILDRAIICAAKTTYLSTNGKEMLNSMEGLQQLVLCTATPGSITRDELAELFKNPTNAMLAAKMVSKVNGSASSQSDKSDSEVQKKVENNSTPS